MGAEQWTRLASPHFELYTTNGEKKGRALILYFEQVRSFFIQASPNKTASDFPARIIVFRGEKEFRPYAFNEVAFAFYHPSRYRDYIVMSDGEPEHLPAAVHEYMHLVINHSGLKIPVWMNEGWAELFSTLKAENNKATIGYLIPGRIQVLQNEKWLSFETLTTVGHNSTIYNEKNRAGIFYAESWALVHMLYLTPEYRPGFTTFLLALNQGKTSAEACQVAFHRSSDQVYDDLRAYLKRNRLYGASFDIKLTKSEEGAEASQATPFESSMMLADLLSTTNKREQATQALQKLAAENPGKPEISQSMGYLAWQNNDRETARTEFAKAFAAGDRDAQMCYHLAMLDMEKDHTSEQAAAALRRAVEVKPDYTEAWLQLGYVNLNSHKYGEALAALKQIHQVDDTKAAGLFNALAYAYMQSGDRVEARKNAEVALKWDRTDSDKQRTQDLIQFLDSRDKTAAAPAAPRIAGLQESTITDERPRLARQAGNPFVKPGEKIERVEGTAKTIDCDNKRFVVEAEGKLLAFDMPDPTRIQLKHEGGDTFEFTCGTQKPFHVVVEYAVSEVPAGNVKGSLRGLEF